LSEVEQGFVESCVDCFIAAQRNATDAALGVGDGEGLVAKVLGGSEDGLLGVLEESAMR
jgi:hypothetical protein